MNQPAAMLTISPGEVAKILWEQRLKWIAPAIGCAILALVAALVLPRTWQASQAMVVRDEVAGAGEGTGRFRAIDDMKAAQETVMELAKSRSVLDAALKQAGPASGGASDSWPSPQAIADLRDAVSLAPPKGAEFGKTEVFYLQVKDASAERAIALNRALSAELQARLQTLRDEKAESTVAELERSVSLAQTDLDQATKALSTLETNVGGDLGELRLLNNGNNGESDLRRKTVEIETELRAAKVARQENEQLLVLLESAREDQTRILATPNRLLDSQPALRRLKDGLVDAQLRTAQLRGTMSDVHPQVMAAVVAEQNVAGELHHELENAVRGVRVDLDFNATRVATLQNQVNANHALLQHLASLRADYANLTADVNQRSELLQKARRELSEARANQAAAKGPGVITLIDTPDTGNRPQGPGRATMVLGGLVAGLGIGLGIVFLTAPLPIRASSVEAASLPAATPVAETAPNAPAGLRGALETIAGRSWSPTA